MGSGALRFGSGFSVSGRAFRGMGMANNQDDREADKRQEDPPEEVVGRMTAALKKALHTPPKPHEAKRSSGKSQANPKRRASQKKGERD